MNILKWDGRPVTEPGIYSGVPITTYHAAVTAKPSISSGGLRTIEGDSLKHYWSTSYLNPKRLPNEGTAAMGLGRALHHLTGGEHKFFEEYAVRPAAWDSWRTKDAQTWRAEQQIEGRTVLVPDELETLRSIADELQAHPTIQAGILNGIVEHSIFWPDPITGIWLKSRPDVIPLDSNMIVDLKTCASAHPLSVRRSISDLNYHMQLALAYEGILMTTGREMTDFVLVFVETKAPYCINIKPIYAEDIDYGRRQNRRALDKFAKALETGEWPGYDDDEVPCGIFDGYRKRLEEEAKVGILPEL